MLKGKIAHLKSLKCKCQSNLAHLRGANSREGENKLVAASSPKIRKFLVKKKMA